MIRFYEGSQCLQIWKQLKNTQTKNLDHESFVVGRLLRRVLKLSWCYIDQKFAPKISFGSTMVVVDQPT